MVEKPAGAAIIDSDEDIDLWERPPPARKSPAAVAAMKEQMRTTVANSGDKIDRNRHDRICSRLLYAWLLGIAMALLVLFIVIVILVTTAQTTQLTVNNGFCQYTRSNTPIVAVGDDYWKCVNHRAIWKRAQQPFYAKGGRESVFGIVSWFCDIGVGGTLCDQMAAGCDYVSCPSGFVCRVHDQFGPGFAQCVAPSAAYNQLNTSAIDLTPVAPGGYYVPGAVFLMGRHDELTVHAVATVNHNVTVLLPVGVVGSVCSVAACSNVPGAVCLNRLAFPSLEHTVFCACPFGYRGPRCGSRETCTSANDRGVSAADLLTKNYAGGNILSTQFDLNITCEAYYNVFNSPWMKTLYYESLGTIDPSLYGLSRNCFYGTCGEPGTAGGVGAVGISTSTSCVCFVGFDGQRCDIQLPPIGIPGITGDSYFVADYSAFSLQFSGAAASVDNGTWPSAAGIYDLVFSDAGAWFGAYDTNVAVKMTLFDRHLIDRLRAPNMGGADDSRIYNWTRWLDCVNSMPGTDTYPCQSTMGLYDYFLSRLLGTPPVYIAIVVSGGAAQNTMQTDVFGLTPAPVPDNVLGPYRYRLVRMDRGQGSSRRTSNVFAAGVNEDANTPGRDGTFDEYLYAKPTAYQDTGYALLMYSNYNARSPRLATLWIGASLPIARFGGDCPMMAGGILPPKAIYPALSSKASMAQLYSAMGVTLKEWATRDSSMAYC